ncbi:hypothetical protein DM02DRAFT_614926 [Periconia macrospinosa]|uniref:Uncharacterized protein n=1 Tax=Periconia macrospinosa TaxID=97972 RepID=A0A2V1DN87_9PLEO|nr:hypothetical protein DM02DRAFT_614926 [Periconia macrospinosa]
MSSLSARRERSRFTPGSASVSFGDGEALSQDRNAPVAATLSEQTTIAQHLGFSIQVCPPTSFLLVRPSLWLCGFFPRPLHLIHRVLFCVVDQFEKAVSFRFVFCIRSFPPF